MRADQLLVAQGLAPTRSVAQRLISNGAAEWASPTGWAALKKAGEDLPETAQLRVTDDAELRYVSRGGLKLEGALTRVGFDVTTHTVLDVGQSTGGFTDCLLAHGARHVVGVDVGHGQLHAKLQADPRVTALEGVHVRELDVLRQHQPTGGFTLIVGDLSFISMVGSLPELLPWLEVHGHLLVLIKPQFELGPQALGKGGLVKDEADYPRLEARVRLACTALGLKVLDYFDSPITGGDGNREFFLWASR
ncbi:23S rRNA (cytidine1920-2'-O)/16S rRNA (cytidine1409-2'-O)-methyltransferase [Pelomonas saccharophila]|uniref:23S rRNA (Cytidine1920-2'-O)/16S rRNA (Cytidine1409-2'-O)-methyltransferase n=1 Tax=Roseateles saccharophilus TaxID=304 RepID=A0ABU1YMG7_ROSSA|nr:TlyA family RNA methyltransferase [Roseateles saccharophilus]MDR7270053.1 23S rRNA (cytidine1920-2'-O)/16S rRNA (cytidine1409-2'-O)-methyltransferase [Roseateles saccharophilus]